MKKIIKLLYKDYVKAYKHGEIPVSCVIVKNNKIIAHSYNKKNQKKSAIYHAEIDTIIKASKKLKDWRLNECEMYITLEPCNMCREVIKQSRIKKVFYFVSSNFNNENSTNTQYIKIEDFPQLTKHNTSILKQFFLNKR